MSPTQSTPPSISAEGDGATMRASRGEPRTSARFSSVDRCTIATTGQGAPASSRLVKVHVTVVPSLTFEGHRNSNPLRLTTVSWLWALEAKAWNTPNNSTATINHATGRRRGTYEGDAPLAERRATINHATGRRRGCHRGRPPPPILNRGNQRHRGRRGDAVGTSASTLPTTSHTRDLVSGTKQSSRPTATQTRRNHNKSHLGAARIGGGRLAMRGCASRSCSLRSRAARATASLNASAKSS